MARRWVAVSQETSRGLDVLSALWHVPPEQVLALLVRDFLETHAEEIEQRQREVGGERGHRQATVIDLESHRGERSRRRPA